MVKNIIFNDVPIYRFNYPWCHHAAEFQTTVAGLKSKNHCVAWRFTRIMADKIPTEKRYLGYSPAIVRFYL